MSEDRNEYQREYRTLERKIEFLLAERFKTEGKPGQSFTEFYKANKPSIIRYPAYRRAPGESDEEFRARLVPKWVIVEKMNKDGKKEPAIKQQVK